MTVSFIRPDPERSHRSFATDRDDPEPPLANLLSDPTLHILMARDGVDRAYLERLVMATRRRLQLTPIRAFEAALFAECGGI